jgi:hypothetical protein
VIGTLVNYLAMKRVNTRGLGQANKCMLMAAVAYNLKKLLNFKTNKVIHHSKSNGNKGRKMPFKAHFSNTSTHTTAYRAKS